MGLKYFSDELPVHQSTLDAWTTAVINARLAQANGIAPLGADGIVPAVHLPEMSLTWGSITGTLSNQTDLLTALGAKASTDSPAFTGTPTAPTAPAGTNTLQVATTAFVMANTPKLPISVAEETITANTTLTATSGKYQVVRATQSITITLPDATTLTESAFSYIISNASSYDVIIKNSSGDFIETLTNSNSSAYTVYDNTIADGIKIFTRFQGSGSMASLSDIIDIIATGLTGDRAQRVELTSTKWLYIKDNLTTSPDVFVVELSGGVYTVGESVEIRPDGATYTYHITAWLQHSNGSVAGIAISNSNSYFSLMSATISGTTITLNNTVLQDVNSPLAGLPENRTAKGSRLTDTTSLVCYYASARVATITASATPTLGTAITLKADTSSTGYPRTLSVVSSTKAFAYTIYISYGFYYLSFVPLTISGTTVTQATPITATLDDTINIEYYHYHDEGFPLDSDSAIVYSSESGEVIKYRGISTGAIAQSKGTFVSVLKIFKLSSTKLMMFYGLSSDAVKVGILDVSGNTPILAKTTSYIFSGHGYNLMDILGITYTAGESNLLLEFIRSNKDIVNAELRVEGITL